jgi:phospho-N-acetylmuramoyl-pentapeptide-transferase
LFISFFSDMISAKLLAVLQSAVPFALSLALLLIFRRKLPKDQGREYAFNGKLSAGKVRGAGIIFVIAFIISSLLFVELKAEYLLYSACIFVSMMSGYLDDRSDNPWNEYKKGLIDLAICAAASFLFAYENPSLLSLTFFVWTAKISMWLFVIIGTIFLWMMINAVNCSDGIDGFSGSLALNSMIFIAIIGSLYLMDKNITVMIIIMIFVLLPYLWFNSEPSTMMMGDAGSRALGIFIGITLMKTGNILLCIPLCFVFLVDGLLGIAKVSLKRFLKISIMKNIQTPIHDHLRKNKGWSNAQTIYRLNIIQAIISAITVFLIK